VFAIDRLPGWFEILWPAVLVLTLPSGELPVPHAGCSDLFEYSQSELAHEAVITR